MAHQAHALPWQTLADNFKFVHANPRYHGRTNLYPRFKPGQAAQLQHFARVFARLIDDFSVQERRKYSDKYTAPEPGETFITDATVKKIEKTVAQYKDSGRNDDAYRGVTDGERQVQYWIIPSAWFSYHAPSSIYECNELFKTLLMWGEMDPLFRLAAHPEISFGRMWRFPDDGGWLDLKEIALTAYLCLNMLYVKPELWDDYSRKKKLEEMKKRNQIAASEELWDYRLLSSYQRMLIEATASGQSRYDTVKYPHREFFGVPKGAYTADPLWLGRCFGTRTLDELVDSKFSGTHVPSQCDIPVALNLLGKKGLPAELALHVLEFADYKPFGRLPLRSDPLNPQNSEELKKYLRYCWKLLVRVDMLLKANGSWIDWEYDVTEVVYKLWGVPYPKMSVIVEDFDYEGSTDNEVHGWRRRRKFA